LREREHVVLVIDDEPPMRDLLSRFLKREGFVVRTAADGETGLKLAKQIRPRAILLDVMMPRMDGWAVLAALKADPELAGIPVIMVTVIGERSLGYSLGAVDYLTKPVEWERLKRMLDRHRCPDPPCPVLLVEDDAATRELLRDRLSRDGWHVVEAENGRVALDRVAENRPALILLDLMMPEMNGIAFVQELRKHPEWRSIPVVVVTAKDITAAEREHLLGQVRQIIQKDKTSLEELIWEVRKTVGAPAAVGGAEARDKLRKAGADVGNVSG
jgi:CheY-like chemotaxis protein